MSMWLQPRLLVIAACGLSAGIHAGLVPDHFEESQAIGASFGVAAVLLAAVATVLALRPDDAWPFAAAASLFAGLIVAYVLFRDEPFDTVAAITKAIEAFGLATSLWLLRMRPAGRPGDLAIAFFGFAFVLAFTMASGADHAH